MIISTNIEKYPDVTLALNRNPKSIGYGYTSDIKELHFMVNDKVDSKLIQHPHGVFLIQQNKPARVTQKMFAFFDTGTTIPFLIVNGDNSFLSSKKSSNPPVINGTGRTYNKLKVIFKDQSLILTIPKAFQTGAPKISDFKNSSINTLNMVLGLNSIAQYNFSFEFENRDKHIATHIHFFNRSK